MNILLDTHILLWALTDDDKMPEKAIKLILDKDNTIFYSIVSIWETELKHIAHPEKMPASGETVDKYCKASGFFMENIKQKHIFGLKTLKRPDNTPPHKDSFDRIMLSQAKTEKMMFITHDARIAEYHEDCIIYV